MSAQLDEEAVKIIEIIGISSTSFDDAIAQALAKSSKTVKRITRFELIKHPACVVGSNIKQHKLNLKLSFPAI